MGRQDSATKTEDHGCHGSSSWTLRRLSDPTRVLQPLAPLDGKPGGDKEHIDSQGTPRRDVGGGPRADS